MKSPRQILPPDNWQDFEALCMRLWGEVWQCPNEIKRNGKIGDNQNGVDIYAIPNGETAYFGIQCKQKEQLTDKKLTNSEIDTEIEKAKLFLPALKVLIFATTATKDAKIEEYIRIKSVELKQQGLFSLMLYSWEDIVLLMSSYRTIYDWYVNDITKHLNASLYFNIESEDTEIIVVHPQYIRWQTEYRLKVPCPYNPFAPFNFQEAMRQTGIKLEQISNGYWEEDHRICRIPFILTNNGDADLQNVRLDVFTEGEKIEDLDDPTHYVNDYRLSEVARVELNRRIEDSREIFLYADNEGIEYIPKQTPIVRGDSRFFHFSIIPKKDVAEISLKWKLFATDYQTEGILTIKVEPTIVDKSQVIEVEKAEDLLPPTTTIKPHIERHYT